ncbi:MAG: alpha/beta hydrolase, partial [Desulfobacterales bacterium]|nr:alpha/beta hydrolase [Desulfobacterales bacterium]
MKFKIIPGCAVILFLMLIPVSGPAAILETDDGALIYYDVRGKGRPVLLVHGWTMSSNVWKRQTDALSDRYQLITMDCRGHGNSSKTLDNHRIPRYAKDIRAVIDHLKIKDVVLAGWSLAGPVVLSYWEQFGDDKIRALVLVDMTPFPFSPGTWNTHGLKNHNYDGMNRIFAALEEDRRKIGTAAVRKMFRDGEPSEEDLEWAVNEHLKTPTNIAIAIYSDYLMRDFIPVLKTITVPAIVFSANSP